ncbi:MAG: RNA polymerase factor sigma-54 [Prevotella sp.]
MAQKLVQTQTQRQVQQLHLSQQQLLNIKLLEMPLTKLEESVKAEMDDNPALEKDYDADEDHLAGNNADDGSDALEEDDSAENNDDSREDREDALDEALQNMGSDDEMPEVYSRQNQNNADYEEIVYGDTTSFYDKLKEQLDMEPLSQKDHDVIEYLIGSLDSDGLLRKDLDTICDELAIYQNIDVDEKTLEKLLHRLQQFDPAGIGARSLQECLLLQIQRKPKSHLRDLMEEVIAHHFEEFTKKHWNRINSALKLSPEQSETLQRELRKLNPKPGAAMGETEGRNMQQVTPDFIVDTEDDGSVTFTINYGDIPNLKVSDSFTQMVDTYRNNKKGMSRGDKEALLYAKEKVDRANSFIEAVKQRRHTLYVTMKAIIDWQKKYFQDGDEADLKPMKLKDISDKTGLDMSTISRVSNQKYAQTRWGIFPLRHFFTGGYTTDDGEELAKQKMMLALKDIIDHEDKKHPLSDIELMRRMAERGCPIARRTVTKYREQLGLPVARLRK